MSESDVREDGGPSGLSLYAHMPVYRSRLAGVRALAERAEPVELAAFHMHYHGAAPLERAARFFGETGMLLDLGCGYGSSLIWLAQRSAGHEVCLGVDLMPEHIEIAGALRERFLAGDQRVRFLAHDIARLSVGLLLAQTGRRLVTSVLALNTFLHLSAEERRRTWRFLDEALAPGGKVYLEDFFARRPLGADEHEAMVNESGCAWLPSRSGYEDSIAEVLSRASIESEDISDSYAAYARARHEAYRGGDPGRRRFYRTLCELLGGGAVGGIRVRITRDAA